MRYVTLALLGLSFAAAVPAQSQMIVTRGPGGGGERRMTFGGNQPVFEESPSDYGVTGWRVGQWVRYAISMNMGQMPMTQVHQVSIVGQQGDRFWVETSDEFAGAMSTRTPITKMLIPFGVVKERVNGESFVLMPDSSVVRRTLLRAASGGADQAGIGFPASWTRVGEEQINVAAGAFRAVHWRKGGENLWVAADAGPLGVVKYESDTISIELAGKGDNARTRVPFGG